MGSESSIDFHLYLITDRKQIYKTQCPKLETRKLLYAIREALRGGVKAVQLREKDMETRDLLKLAHQMRELTNNYGTRLFINDRFDIAMAVGADGIQLTQNSIPVKAVRKVVKKKLLIGVSTHSMKEAKEAEQGGADFITLGPVYKTPSKRKYGTPVGLGTLERVTRGVGIPVFAIGGIKRGKIKEVQEAGASGAALISEIFLSKNIRKKAEELVYILSGQTNGRVRMNNRVRESYE